MGSFITKQYYDPVGFCNVGQQSFTPTSPFKVITH